LAQIMKFNRKVMVCGDEELDEHWDCS
jgi:hypothetical protein